MRRSASSASPAKGGSARRRASSSVAVGGSYHGGARLDPVPIYVTRADVQRLLAEGAQLVEVLPRAEYDERHIAGG
jgi:hypothetical protein